MESNCYICLCVRNCEKYLDNVFNNIIIIEKLFNEIHLLVAYDTSDDKSLDKLEFYKDKFKKFDIIMNKDKLSIIRIENISNARNRILEKIRYYKQNDIYNVWNYFIMMDADDVNIKKINISSISKFLKNTTNWDCISFNRPFYYDTYAISFKPHILNKNSWYKKNNISIKVADIKRVSIIKKLNNIVSDELIQVYSAFNGFCIYKVDKFIDCKYSHVSRLDNMNIKEVQDNINLLINNYEYNYDAKLNCEHVNFHLDSILKHNSKVCISAHYLFEYNIVEFFLFKLLEYAYIFYIHVICYIYGIDIY